MAADRDYPERSARGQFIKNYPFFFCVFSFILPVALVAVDLDREFLSIDPESFVNNMPQGMASGICIFCSAPKMGADEFFSFFKETIQYYIDRAFAVYTSASIAGDEMEPAVHVCIDGKPVIRICGKYSPTREPRGSAMCLGGLRMMRV